MIRTHRESSNHKWTWGEQFCFDKVENQDSAPKNYCTAIRYRRRVRNRPHSGQKNSIYHHTNEWQYLTRRSRVPWPYLSIPRSWPAVISCSCYSESSGVPSPDEIESDQVPNYSLKAAAGWGRKTGDWSLESPQLTGNACCGSCWQPGCVFFLNPKCRSTLFICQNNFWQARCSPFVCKFIFRSQFVGIFWTYNLYMHKLLHVPCTIHSTWSNTATVVRPQNDSNKLKFKINFSQFGTRVYKLWVSSFAILLFECYNAQAAVCIRRITEFRRLYYLYIAIAFASLAFGIRVIIIVKTRTKRVCLYDHIYLLPR